MVNVRPLKQNSQISLDLEVKTYEMSSRYGFPFFLGYIVSFGSVEDLEELGHAMPHSTVHVCFGAFDVVV